jgi:hypothetical protein
MNRVKLSAKGLLLISGIGIAVSRRITLTPRLITITGRITGLASPPAAGIRASGTASPMALAASSRPVLVTPHKWLWSRPRAKRRVWPPAGNLAGSDPRSANRSGRLARSAGGGLCRSPACRGGVSPYMRAGVYCQYRNLVIRNNPGSNPMKRRLGSLPCYPPDRAIRTP